MSLSLIRRASGKTLSSVAAKRRGGAANEANEEWNGCENGMAWCLQNRYRSICYLFSA